MTAAEALVELMVKFGIRTVYGIVGDSANPIVDAIRTRPELTFVHVRNEEAGAFAAGADAQVSDRPVAVLGSSGPGSLHLLNGLYDCMRNGAPVFAIATHIPSTEIGSRYFQETAPEQVFSDCTEYLGYINTPAQTLRVAEQALQAAVLDRGVGMVVIPGDVAAAALPKGDTPRESVVTRPVIRPTSAALDQAADLIDRAEKVVIYGGEGTRGARSDVLALSQALKAPVAYSYRGKDVLEADNESAMGMTGLLGWGGAYDAMHDCDLLLMLGTDFPYRPFLPSDCTTIQVDDNADHIGRRTDVALGLVGDVGETVRGLIERVTPRTDGTFLAHCQERHHRAVTKLQTYVTHKGSGRGLRPERVADALSRLADDDAVFTVDTGMCNVWGARYLHMKRSQRILASYGHGSMANAMPQALGAAMGSPGRQVVALCGDGGFSMLMGELLTLAASDLPVKLMIFNNSTLGMVRAEMMVAGYEPFGTDVTNPDFGALARAAGMHGERVENPDEIDDAIRRAFAEPGPALIDFVTDPRALSMPPHTTLEQVRGFALAATRTVLHGDMEEMVDQARSNIRDVGQVL